LSLREYIEKLKYHNLLLNISKAIDLDGEITKELQENTGKAIFFQNPTESDYPLVGNLLTSREQLQLLFNSEKDYFTKFQHAIENPLKPEESEESLTFENKRNVNLLKLPIPKFFPGDGGRYLTSAIVFAEIPDSKAVNASIHRIMVLDEKNAVIRIVPRDLYNIYHENKKRGIDTPVALVIGYNPLLALAASTPQPYGKSEMSIANSLFGGKLKLVETPNYGIKVPTDVEFVIEGKILANEEAAEGPFVDITGTTDNIRKQPLIRLERLYHRKDPIFQTILPAYEEHYILMGFPKEVQIYNNAKKIIPEVHGVYLTPGGCGWLHAVIAITPQKLGDAKNVGLAAFAAHPSLKWCTIVDGDIDIFNNKAVEWATITRAGIGDITIIERVRGSSLDPSRDKKDGTTIKVIIDATKKGEKERKGYERVVPFKD